MVSADSVAVFRAGGLIEKYPDRVVEVGIADRTPSWPPRGWHPRA
jgi:transketolase C-terminal domain/subunit